MRSRFTSTIREGLLKIFGSLPRFPEITPPVPLNGSPHGSRWQTQRNRSAQSDLRNGCHGTVVTGLTKSGEIASIPSYISGSFPFPRFPTLLFRADKHERQFVFVPPSYRSKRRHRPKCKAIAVGRLHVDSCYGRWVFGSRGHFETMVTGLWIHNDRAR